jgi:hypothetical protein
MRLEDIEADTGHVPLEAKRRRLPYTLPGVGVADSKRLGLISLSGLC